MRAIERPSKNVTADIYDHFQEKPKWPGPGSNRRHTDFQSYDQLTQNPQDSQGKPAIGDTDQALGMRKWSHYAQAIANTDPAAVEQQRANGLSELACEIFLKLASLSQAEQIQALEQIDRLAGGSTSPEPKAVTRRPKHST